MNFKVLVCIAAIILTPLAASLGQKKTAKKPQPTVLLDVGKGGQIILTVRSKNAGTFSLIDAKGLTTHAGKWRDQNGHLTWKSQTGEPAIEGKTFRMEGAWRVHWKLSGDARLGANRQAFTYAASRSATIQDAQLRPQVAKKAQVAQSNKSAENQAAVTQAQLVKKVKNPIHKKSQAKRHSKKQTVAVLCFGSKSKKDSTKNEEIAKN